uniref:Kinase n=1 Tax=Bursaphelenchus xylophilus TaxID=6326 RepID=A0A1I7RL09_BURXY
MVSNEGRLSSSIISQRIQSKALSVAWLVRLQMGSVQSQPTAPTGPTQTPKLGGLCPQGTANICCMSKSKRFKSRKQESTEIYEPTGGESRLDHFTEKATDPRPSMVAATVATQWKHGSVKKQPLCEKPSIVSFSDDSLLNEDVNYNLSEQSHEVLEQIIRCFPFPVSPPDQPKLQARQKLSIGRTVSNDPTVLLSDHPSAKEIHSDGIKSLEAPPTAQARGWGVRKRQLGAFLSRRLNSDDSTQVVARKSDNNNMNTLCDKDEKRGALGRLCQVLASLLAKKKRPESKVNGSSSASLLCSCVRRRSSVVSEVADDSVNEYHDHPSVSRAVHNSVHEMLQIHVDDHQVMPSCSAPMEFRHLLKASLLQVSVDTMAITALPLDCWLKERLKNWVQLSGHEGTIVPATNHTLWKKQPPGNNIEAEAYQKIMADPSLKGLTPKFFKEMVHNNESFIEMQDLLSQFPNTRERAVMDIKVGCRTFLESEVANTTKRKDLYKKMVDIDPNEPTDEERQVEAITKLRYMQFRERESSTSSLGFRIEAAQLPGGKLEKSFKKVRTKAQVLDTFNHFFGKRREEIKAQLAARLKEMRNGIERSDFFRKHEVVGSSILIIFDDVRTGAWIIDFAKSIPVPEDLSLDHRTGWKLGNHEDGYLLGLDNLIQILEWEWN